MDPLSAFSLAANVIATVDFGLKTISLCRKASKLKQPLPDLVETGTSFESSITALKIALENTKDETLTAHDQRLMDICGQCQACAHQLLRELEKLKVTDGKGKWYEAVGSAFKAMWKMKALEKLGNTLETHRHALDTAVLVDLRKRFNISELQQCNGFERLNQQTQDIIRRLDADRSDLKAVAAGIQERTRDDISYGISELQLGAAKSEHHRRVLDSLLFREMNTRLEEVADAHATTFEWIFRQEDISDQVPASGFVPWLENDCGIFWISGRPGSGKSTLMRFIWEDHRTKKALNTWSGSSSVVMAAFFVWNPGHAQFQKNICGLLRACLYQVFFSCTDLIESVVPSQSHQIPFWTEKRLLQTLKQVFSRTRSSHTFCIFLDGLDELEGDHGVIVSYIKEFCAFQNVKMCISSRSYPNFERAFQSCAGLGVHIYTSRDIHVYVHDRLSSEDIRYEGTTLTKDIRSKLIADTTNRADGVFLWVKLAVSTLVEGLLNQDESVQLFQKLEQLPTELYDLYSHLYDRIKPAYRNEAMRYLQMVAENQDQDEPYPSLTILTIAMIEFGSDGGESNMEKQTTEVELLNKCRVTRARIRACCAGLLDFGFCNTSHLCRRGASVHCGHLEYIQQVKQPFTLSNFDGDNATVGFPHRSAREFLLHRLDLSSADATWEPNLGLADAYRKRVMILPWNCQLARNFLLDDVYWALRYLRQYDRKTKRSCEDQLEKLSHAVSVLVHEPSLLPLASFGASIWTLFAGLNAHAPYIGVATDVHGVSALWGFKHTIRQSLKLGDVDATYLLQCASNVLAGRADRKDERFSPELEQWMASSIFRSLLQHGADPNIKYMPRPRTTELSILTSEEHSEPTGVTRQHTPFGMYGIRHVAASEATCTPWTSVLEIIARRQQVDCIKSEHYKDIKLISMFLRHGADFQAANDDSALSQTGLSTQVHLMSLDTNVRFTLGIAMNIKAFLEQVNGPPSRLKRVSIDEHRKIRHCCSELMQDANIQRAQAVARIDIVAYEIRSHPSISTEGRRALQHRSLTSTSEREITGFKDPIEPYIRTWIDHKNPYVGNVLWRYFNIRVPDLQLFSRNDGGSRAARKALLVLYTAILNRIGQAENDPALASLTFPDLAVNTSNLGFDADGVSANAEQVEPKASETSESTVGA